MKAGNFVKFYPSDFLEGTRGMPTESIGHYIRLLCFIYDRDGKVQNDPYVLRHVLQCRLQDVGRHIDRLIYFGKLSIDEHGTLHNGRADVEIERFNGGYQKRVSNVEVAAAMGAAAPQSTQPKKSTKTTRAQRNQKPDSTFNKVESGAARRFARTSARAPPDFSQFLLGEALELYQRENGHHEPKTINGDVRRLETGNRPAETGEPDPAGPPADEKPH